MDADEAARITRDAWAVVVAERDAELSRLREALRDVCKPGKLMVEFFKEYCRHNIEGTTLGNLEEAVARAEELLK